MIGDDTGVAPVYCPFGEHLLTCGCGDIVERTPIGDEWGYRSTTTGLTMVNTTPAALRNLDWNLLAKTDIALYSMLSARANLRGGSLNTYHWHQPVGCPDGLLRTVSHDCPECCDWPMRFSPRGWVCRQAPGGRH